MSGWKVLLVLHFVGWGFLTLWVLGTCWKERMWGNVVTCFNWWQALMISTLGQVVVKKVVIAALGEPQTSDDYFTVDAATIALGWILLIAVFGGLKAWTEKLSRVKIAFHPVLDGLGNLYACLQLAGLLNLATLPLLVLVLVGTAAATGGVELPQDKSWLKGVGEGLPWQMATMFCGYWILVAVAVVVLSKPSKRLEKPKKAEVEA